MTTWWIWSLLCILLSAPFSNIMCGHHKATAQTITNTSITDQEKVQGEASGNETEDVYQPLRIHLHHAASGSLDANRGVKTMVLDAVHRAAQKVSSVLSVVPISGPLLLPRTSACQVVLHGGINAGKCRNLTKGYTGERCTNLFLIPEAHLEGIALYNATFPGPLHETDAGPGVNDTDIILYITSTATRRCLSDQSVLAHASHCRVDGSGRPLAGLVNFCPFTLTKSTVVPQFVYTTALHEILHVLGFSTNLFKTFGHCTGNACNGKPSYKLVDGQYRLVSPAVVRATQQHFNCHIDGDYGGPLDTKMDYRGYVQTKVPASHWDPLMMFSSLMTAHTDHTSYAVLDPITLAVFEDSGWYRVNYSNADPFLWGKGAGCSFAQAGQCLLDNKHFCSDNSSGCHFLRRDKGVCDAVERGSQCGVYVPAPQGSCVQTHKNLPADADSLEIFSASSRCFLSSVAGPSSQVDGAHVVGRCYERRCSDNGTLFLRLQGTQWIPCPHGEIIQITGYRGTVVCPDSTDAVCLQDVESLPVQTSTQKQVRTTKMTEVTMKIQASTQPERFTSTAASAASWRSILTLSRWQTCLIIGCCVCLLYLL